MTIDERLEALTMNLELTARDVADLTRDVANLTQAVAEQQKDTASIRENTAEFQRATAERAALWELEKKHLDEKVDSLAESVGMLLKVVQIHQVRLDRLDRAS